MARKKKKRIRHVRFFIGLCLAAIFFFIFIFIVFVRPHLTRPGFEIYVPSGYAVHGIDVSRYQQKINWAAVKKMDSGGERIWFVFIKATEGVNNVDPWFEENWEGTKEQGIARGAYHYFIAGRDPVQQANNFIENVSLGPGDLPPVLDIEKAGRLPVTRIQNDAKTWLDTIEKYYGTVPVIYTNISFYEKYFSTGFEKYPLWIAHYKEAYRPRIDKDWTIWQHNETGRVDGIKAPVDFNVFNGDSVAFKNFLINR